MVSQFGNPRIDACLRLPEAYRSLPRPSSAPIAKAFALRPFLLDLREFLRSNLRYSSLVTIVSSTIRLLCSFSENPSGLPFSTFKSFLHLLFHHIPMMSAASLFSFQGTLVGSSGLEPPTSRLSGARSNHLSYEPISFLGSHSLKSFPWWR